MPRHSSYSAEVRERAIRMVQKQTSAHGLGLASLRERALCVGGTAAVRSRPGTGTTIDALLPLRAT